MPKSCTGSRYTGYSCTSSRLRKVASEVTGPGVTKWRLVRIRPRSASMTKPVACAVVFHSVSKARVWSTSIDTTLGAMRSSVTAQSGLPSTATAACAALGWPVSPAGGGGPGAFGGGCAGGTAVAMLGVAGAATGPAASHSAVQDSSRRLKHRRCRRRIRFSGFLAAKQHDQPHHHEQHEGHQNCRRTDVLGESGELVALQSDAIDGGLDGAVQQFHDEDDEYRRHQQRPFNGAMAQPQSQRYDDDGEGKFLTERGFLAIGPLQAVPAGGEGPQYACQAPGFVAVCGGSVGFHVRSSCLAARTSSRRRTGMVCGALVTRAGSCSASFWICDMAVTKASSIWRLSVSVGSISRHSGTRSGKLVVGAWKP